ncbi:methionyl-tRNA formyltransferase [Algicella marina]|uniref:Methionyl-tRNA formyltransferase n=1 Tax=Algicella marina TaxID=2683284 RepID=A0A6P1T5N8_9RHOB|nr:methionyl-tRNA formyltransferase [Algicella marina]QHQ37065.1 methionyl-tRNA formyltransferase [Algicella marina]
MRVIFMGTPAFSVQALNALVDAGHEIAAVYTQPPRRADRGKKMRPSPVQVRAEEMGLPVRYPVNFRDEEDREAFAALKADIAVVVAYGLILPQAILDAPLHGCLNIHASLLPRWRGAAPIHRALMAGDQETGVAIMQMEAGLDTGPVLLERRIAIRSDDTTGSLHDRLARLGGQLICEALSAWPLEALPQAKEGVTYAEKISKAEAEIDWTQSAFDVDRQVRGLSPAPGAWTLMGGERVKVLLSRVANGDGAPGMVLKGTTIACGSGAVELLRLQRPGKGALGATDFLRGFPLSEGVTLGTKQDQG